MLMYNALTRKHGKASNQQGYDITLLLLQLILAFQGSGRPMPLHNDGTMQCHNDGTIQCILILENYCLSVCVSVCASVCLHEATIQACLKGHNLDVEAQHQAQDFQFHDNRTYIFRLSMGAFENISHSATSTDLGLN